jgi:hypothetical protein
LGVEGEAESEQICLVCPGENWGGFCGLAGHCELRWGEGGRNGAILR